MFHCFLPFALLLIIAFHVRLACASGQNSVIPSRLPASGERISAFPVYALKNLMAVSLYLFALCLLCLVFPNAFSNKLNYKTADFCNTPADVKSGWRFALYHSTLRAFKSKLVGMLAMGLTLVFITVLPYIHEDLSSDVFKA